jgi:hypothetical protein
LINRDTRKSGSQVSLSSRLTTRQPNVSATLAIALIFIPQGPLSRPWAKNTVKFGIRFSRQK